MNHFMTLLHRLRVSRLCGQGNAVVFLLLIELFINVPSTAHSGGADVENEHRVKTAFIYQFTNYVEWPKDQRTLAATEPFLVTIIGNSPLVQELHNIAKAKTVKGRPIEIDHLQDSSKIRKSQMIIIAGSDDKALRDILERTKNMGALIISHADGFAKKGSMINFFIEDGRLRFEINRPALEEGQLQVSSQLLKLAKIVE